MSKLQQAKDYMDKSREMLRGSTRFFLDFQQQARADKRVIEQDPDLNGDAKLRRKADISAKRGVEFLQKAHTRKQEYLTNVQKARKIADELVYASIKKPDQTKIDRFEASLRTFKTELMFVADQRHAYDKLNEFTRKIDDPYLANMFREQFGEISAHVLSTNGDNQLLVEGPGGGGDKAVLPLKTLLGRMYSRLQDDFESPEVKEARQLLEEATDCIKNPRLFDLAGDAPDISRVRRSAADEFGLIYGQFINDTDTFFENHPEQKPADYIDPETATETKKVPWWQQMPDNPTYNPQASTKTQSQEAAN